MTEHLNRGFKRSLIVWGVLIGAGVIYAIFDWVPDPRARLVCYVIAAIETYTIIDRWKNNTLSEALWFLSRRPLVPVLFGVALGMAIGRGVVDPFSASLGMLYGHFFWQAYGGSSMEEPKAGALALAPTYAEALMRARVAAKGYGYAIAFHGSGTRDLDLVAIPWTDRATEPERMVRSVAGAVRGVLQSDDPHSKPHGRLCWTIMLIDYHGSGPHIDLSVTPWTTPAPSEATGGA